MLVCRTWYPKIRFIIISDFYQEYSIKKANTTGRFLDLYPFLSQFYIFLQKDTIGIFCYLINHIIADTVLIYLDVIWSHEKISVITVFQSLHLLGNPYFWYSIFCRKSTHKKEEFLIPNPQKQYKLLSQNFHECALLFSLQNHFLSTSLFQYTEGLTFSPSYTFPISIS